MQNNLDSNSGAKEKKYVHAATFLPLKGWRYMIPFQLMSSKVLKQAKQSHGIVDYAVRADFPKKHFWTLSIWKDRNSMRQFVMAEPHITAMKNLKNGLERDLHLQIGLAQAVQLTGKKQ
jgi:hypothetical protein